MDWKLQRGKWRPRLLDFAKQADPAAVEGASRAAFQALGGSSSSGDSGSAGSRQPGSSQEAAEPTETAIKQALAELCVLKVGAGCGGEPQAPACGSGEGLGFGFG